MEIKPVPFTEPEGESTFIYPGVHRCSKFPSIGVVIKTTVPTKDSSAIRNGLSITKRRIDVCKEKGGDIRCPENCELSGLKNRLEFYLQQNRNNSEGH